MTDKPLGADLHQLSAVVTRAWTARRDNAWVGCVATPLGMTATGLLGQWWTWPVLVAVAAALTRAWRGSWALTLLLGWLGTAWASDGIGWLSSPGANVLLVGAVWAAIPLVLALAGWEHRRRRGGVEFQRLW